MSSEWPKRFARESRFGINGWGEITDDGEHWEAAEVVELVPADLGRELYEALKPLLSEAKRGFHDNDDWEKVVDPETDKLTGREFLPARAALARYEREVDNSKS